MKTIVKALQDLYVALGGKSSDVSGLALNPDVIEQIAALVNEGALNELPAVTIEDAGDVLTVSADGEWEAAAPSSGGLTLYGPYSAHPSEDKTLQAGSLGSVLLDVYTDNNGNSVSFPSGDYEYNAVLLNAIYATHLNTKAFSICGVAPPSIWGGGTLSVMNNTSSSVTLSKDSIGVDFYTTFPMDVEN